MRFLEPLAGLGVVFIDRIINGDVVKGVRMIWKLFGLKRRDLEETFIVFGILLLFVINAVTVQLVRDELVGRGR